MNRSAPSSPAVARDGIDFSAALALLHEAGVVLPQRDSAPGPWLQAVIDGLCDLSSRDALTGLANRRAFEFELERELDRVARAGESALLLLLDIDHFKSVNDRHGHAVGDVALKAVARALQDSVRPMDTVARYGGEEFAIVLPNCAAAFGEAVAERVRRTVERRPIDIGAGGPLHLTVSLGGAFAPQWVRSTAALWIERADRQLYRAKAGGRNRTCLEPPPLSPVSAEEKGLLFGTSQYQDLVE